MYLEAYQCVGMMKLIRFNRDKNIGKVLLIVEGLDTEFYLMHRLFTRVFNFQFEKLNRMFKYQKSNPQENIQSSVFVINTKESALKFVNDADEFLDNMFETLIEKYNFPVDRAAIFYVFDRDVKSNTDPVHIRNLMRSLSSSRESNGFEMQGLFLMSYPAIESFVASNFIDNSFGLEFETGDELKTYLAANKVNQCRINDVTLSKAVSEMDSALKQLRIDDYNLDHFSDTNLFIFNQQEEYFLNHRKYRLISLVCMILLDLGLVEIEEPGEAYP